MSPLLYNLELIIDHLYTEEILYYDKISIRYILVYFYDGLGLNPIDNYNSDSNYFKKFSS